MKIYIPTRGRTGRQITLRHLAGTKLRDKVTIVCPSDEAASFRLIYPWLEVLEQADDDFTIAKKREWIMRLASEQGHEKIVMFDDDLHFYVRREDKPDRLRYTKASDIEFWLSELEQKLSEETPHAGFGARQGNNNREAGWQTPDRMMLALGYHLPTVLREVELGRIETREDMDVALQLLRKGYPNAVCHTFVVGQEGAGYAATGGCSGQRTTEASNADAHRLAELHPGYVRVVERAYRSSVPRAEVVCSWAKALRDGTRSR